MPKVKTKIGNTLYLDNIKKISKQLNTILQIKKFLKKKELLLEMINKKLSAGIIDLKFNNLFSIYKACIKAGFKTQ